MSEKVKYWTELADYDFDTAKALLESKRNLYVGFMCHQTIEKMLKAYYTKLFDEIPPYTHRLSFLTEKTGLEGILSEDQKGTIDELEPLNIEARYPQYKQEIFRIMTDEKCVHVLKVTEELKQWIEKKL